MTRPRTTGKAPAAGKQDGALDQAADHTSNPRLAQALLLAKQGFSVVPLHYPISTGERAECSCSKLAKCAHLGKHPMFARGTLEHGAKSATTNPDVITRWFTTWKNANIGIAPGMAYGVLVFDIDPRNGGDVEFAALQESLGALPHTVECLTGGGGRHLYFQHPGAKAVGKLGPGVDVLSDGVCVVAPGSLHKSGEVYEWELSSSPDLVEVAALPEAWKRRVLSLDGEGEERDQEVYRDEGDDGDVGDNQHKPSAVVPAVPVRCGQDVGDWDEDSVISATLPLTRGQHDEKTNDFARGVKFNLGIVDVAHAHAIFLRWWTKASPVCEEKDPDAAWGKFCRAHKLARFPLGYTSPFALAVANALKKPFPKLPLPTSGLNLPHLAGACREMAVLMRGNFKLSCAQIAKEMRCAKTTAWEWLRLLEQMHILRCLDRGRSGHPGAGAAKFEYIGPMDDKEVTP